MYCLRAIFGSAGGVPRGPAARARGRLVPGGPRVLGPAAPLGLRTVFVSANAMVPDSPARLPSCLRSLRAHTPPRSPPRTTIVPAGRDAAAQGRRPSRRTPARHSPAPPAWSPRHAALPGALILFSCSGSTTGGVTETAASGSRGGRGPMASDGREPHRPSERSAGAACCSASTRCTSADAVRCLRPHDWNPLPSPSPWRMRRQMTQMVSDIAAGDDPDRAMVLGAGGVGRSRLPRPPPPDAHPTLRSSSRPRARSRR
jgi:hypothetical protein